MYDFGSIPSASRIVARASIQRRESRVLEGTCTGCRGKKAETERRVRSACWSDQQKPSKNTMAEIIQYLFSAFFRFRVLFINPEHPSPSIHSTLLAPASIPFEIIAETTPYGCQSLLRSSNPDSLQSSNTHCDLLAYVSCRASLSSYT